MIIVTGTVKVGTDQIDEALRVSLEHVHRSRTEPGCLQHSVHRDVEDPFTLFFFEQWRDAAALSDHFAVPGSRDFVNAIAGLATERPVMDIFEATIR
jgi:quinol monooxygenase YgiN